MQYDVFYSWASDHPETNTKLIRKALDKAIKALAKKGFNVRRDEATRDAAGAPDIPTTILQKIMSADALVADVSLIDRPESCNPNVLFELGFAWAHLGDAKIITVFNEAFGQMSDLPFDIKTKRHLAYQATDQPGVDLSSTIDILARDLTTALSRVLMGNVTDWADDIAPHLVELLIMFDEYDDRLSLDRWNLSLHGTADIIRRQARDDYADQVGVRTEMLELAQTCDEFMQTDGLDHAKSFHIADYNRAQELAAGVFSKIAPHTTTGLKQNALPRLQTAVTDLYDLSSRAIRMIETGRYEDLQSAVTKIGEDLFALCFFPMSFLSTSELDAIRRAARSLHFFDQRDLHSGGDPEEERQAIDEPMCEIASALDRFN